MKKIVINKLVDQVKSKENRILKLWTIPGETE